MRGQHDNSLPALPWEQAVQSEHAEGSRVLRGRCFHCPEQLRGAQVAGVRVMSYMGEQLSYQVAGVERLQSKLTS